MPGINRGIPQNGVNKLYKLILGVTVHDIVG